MLCWTVLGRQSVRRALADRPAGLGARLQMEPPGPLHTRDSHRHRVSYYPGLLWQLVFTAPSRYGVDFCRVPADCSVCSEVDQVEEVAVEDLSVELFQERSEQYFVS